MRLKNVLGMLKGKNRYETMENCSIASLFAGALILSLGIGLSALSPSRAPAVLAMLGAFISFVSTIALIISWVLKEYLVKPEIEAKE